MVETIRTERPRVAAWGRGVVLTLSLLVVGMIGSLPSARAVPAPHHVAVGGGTVHGSQHTLQIRASTAFGGEGEATVDGTTFNVACAEVVQTEFGVDQLHAEAFRYRSPGGRPEFVYLVVRDGLVADQARVDWFTVESAPCGAGGALGSVSGRFVIAP